MPARESVGHEDRVRGEKAFGAAASDDLQFPHGAVPARIDPEKRHHFARTSHDRGSRDDRSERSASPEKGERSKGFHRHSRGTGDHEIAPAGESGGRPPGRAGEAPTRVMETG